MVKVVTLLTVYCTGVGSSSVLLCPFPKSQFQVTTEPVAPVVVFVIVHVAAEQVTSKSATGPPGVGAVTVTVLLILSVLPSLSVAVRVTSYVPAAAKV